MCSRMVACSTGQPGRRHHTDSCASVVLDRGSTCKFVHFPWQPPMQQALCECILKLEMEVMRHTTCVHMNCGHHMPVLCTWKIYHIALGYLLQQAVKNPASAGLLLVKKRCCSAHKLTKSFLSTCIHRRDQSQTPARTYKDMPALASMTVRCATNSSNNSLTL